MRTPEVYLNAVANIPPEICKETYYSFRIADAIHSALLRKGVTQKEFARTMKKTESEISVWLSGQHNFTIRTLAKISVALGIDLIKIENDSLEADLMRSGGK